jgi:hypothetical protein
VFAKPTHRKVCDEWGTRPTKVKRGGTHMFVEPVDLGNGTMLELVIIPLKDTTLPGQWSASTDLVMLCDVQRGRCCTCKLSDLSYRYSDKLGLSESDAEGLSRWLKTNQEKVK